MTMKGVKNNILVFTVIATVNLIMLLETYLTLALVRWLASGIFTSQRETYGLLDVTVCLLQLGSYLISPAVCYGKKLAVNNDIRSAELLWNNATPVKEIKPGFCKAGPVLWWGLPGMITFAPAVWKMGWAGKTVLMDGQVYSKPKIYC